LLNFGRHALNVSSSGVITDQNHSHRLWLWWKSVNIWRRYGHKFAAYFSGPPCILGLMPPLYLLLTPLRTLTSMYGLYACLC